MQQRISDHKEDIKNLKTLREAVLDPEQKQEITRLIEIREKQKLVLEARAYEIARTEIDSVQTDALSMSTHDKANKATVTAVVKGVKLAARIAAGALVGKHLHIEVVRKTKQPDQVVTTPDQVIKTPGTTKTVQEIIYKEIHGMSPEQIKDISFRDIQNLVNDPTIFTKTVEGGVSTNSIPADFFRGLRFEYNGEVYSGIDALGFRPGRARIVASVDINPIKDQTSIVEVMQEIISKQTGDYITTDKIAEMIGKEINGICLNSGHSTGEISGWSVDVTNIITKMIQEHTRKVPKMVEKLVKIPGTTKIIPGTTIVIPGEVITETVRQINPAVVAAEAAIAGLAADDFNNAARWTRSQENIEIRAPGEFKKMEEENASESKKAGKPYKKKSISPPKKRSGIKTFRRTKPPKRSYSNPSPKLTKPFTGFTGERKGDFGSGYDENAFQANEPDPTSNITEYDERGD